MLLITKIIYKMIDIKPDTEFVSFFQHWQNKYGL
jgi:hypothetical protein